MATINRPGLIFPTLKVGDTYPAFEIPDQVADEFPPGTTVLGQIRDAAGLLWYSWPGTVPGGKATLNAIPPSEARQFKGQDYTAEVQVTKPDGVVITIVHAGKLKAESDNCYPQITPPLISPGDDSGSPGTSSTLDFRTFTYIGEGPYETPFPPNGSTVVLFFDIGLVPGPDLPMTLTAEGFLLTDAAAPGDPGAPETVSLFYSHN